MKILIVTNGKTFKIKRKGLFFWTWIDIPFGHKFYRYKGEVAEFDSFKTALDFMVDEYGNQFTLINSSLWTPVILDKYRELEVSREHSELKIVSK
jgi:hypothetical protein